MSSRVFIIHRTKIKGPYNTRVDQHDYSSARKYGELVDIFIDQEVRIDSVEVIKTLESMLVNFSDEDSILCVGDPLTLVAAGLVLGRLDDPVFTKIRLLKWDRLKKSYFPADIDFNNIG